MIKETILAKNDGEVVLAILRYGDDMETEFVINVLTDHQDTEVDLLPGEALKLCDFLNEIKCHIMPESEKVRQ